MVQIADGESGSAIRGKLNKLLRGVSGVSQEAGSNYTFDIDDAGTRKRFTNASAVVATVPPNSSVAFAIGDVIEVEWSGVGSLTIAEGLGVTILTPETFSLVKRWSVACLEKVATDTWSLVGGLATRGTVAIVFTLGDTLVEDAIVGTVVGTASVTSGLRPYTFALSDDDAGKYAVDPDTGVVTVADVLAAGDDAIMITANDGIEPELTDDETITVTSAAWTPLSLGSRLAVWLKADAGLTIGSGKIASWVDQSANGYTFAQADTAKRFPYEATGLGGKETSVQNSVDDTVMTATIDAGVNQHAWFFLGSCFTDLSNGDVNGRYLAFIGAGGSAAWNETTSVAAITRMGGGVNLVGTRNGNDVAATGNFIAEDEHVIGFVYGATTVKSYVDGVEVGSTVDTAQMLGLTGTMYVGATDMASSQGKMREIIVVMGSLSGGDIASINNYLASRI